jgi:mono/diheme cytochrome c family protein
VRKLSTDLVAIVRCHALVATIAIVFFLKNVGAQAPTTYYGQVQAIVNKNCIQCHRPNGGAPFPLLNYKQVAERATFIAHVNMHYSPSPVPATDHSSVEIWYAPINPTVS